MHQGHGRYCYLYLYFFFLGGGGLVELWGWELETTREGKGMNCLTSTSVFQ